MRFRTFSRSDSWAKARSLDRARPCQRDDSRLGRGVVLTARHALDGGQARDADEAPAAAPVDHVAGGALERQERAVEVQGDDLAELVERHVDEGRLQIAATRVREARVDPAELLQGAHEGVADRLRVADVAD